MHKFNDRRRCTATKTLLYTGLKIYALTRSRKVIDTLQAHGLCVSYERILRFTQGLSEAPIQFFEQDDAVYSSFPLFLTKIPKEVMRNM